ncbi:MAG: hypothetical protein R3B13_18000 [Polyangiaceae bacterium]
MRLGYLSCLILMAGTACGGSDDAGLSGSGGASAGAAGSGASSGTTGVGGSAGTSGSSGSGAGGSSGSAGGAGTSSGGATGDGGSPSGGATGDGGAPSGGAGGIGTGGVGTGGVSTGGVGTGGIGTGGIGTGGVGTGGLGTGGGCTVMKTWCQDQDKDGYGDPSTEKQSCLSPGAGWILKDSKPRACEDCNDKEEHAFPNSTWCDGIGYTVSGGVSFDFNCDSKETECGAPSIKAVGAGCVVDPSSCKGAGYLPTGRTGPNENPYCGSDKFRVCVSSAADECKESIQQYNPIVCK